MGMFAGAAKDAPFVGWGMFTVGGGLVTTAMCTGRLMLVAPTLSVAFAVSSLSLHDALPIFRKKVLLNALVALVLVPKPRLWLLAKNSTDTTKPLVSRADARMGMFAGAVKN